MYSSQKSKELFEHEGKPKKNKSNKYTECNIQCTYTQQDVDGIKKAVKDTVCLCQSLNKIVDKFELKPQISDLGAPNLQIANSHLSGQYQSPSIS